MIVKEGKKWLATLYAALKEKKPHRSYEKEDMAIEDMEEGEYVEDDTDTDDHRTRSDYGTGSSRLMRISLLRISLLRFFKTITKIWLIRFYGLFILLLRT